MKPIFLSAILSSIAFSSVAQDYDVAIMNGRVMDPETGFEQIANVGVSNGWISKITSEAITGVETIDATGHVVAPGFIDLEQHGIDPWGIKVNLRDGVTTQMDFELGALNIAEWYAAREGKTQANFGTVVGQEYARMRIHDGMALEGPDVSMPLTLSVHRAEAAEDGVDGWSTTKSTLEQMNQITQILDEGPMQGALGVGSTIGYAREGITTYEMLEAQKIAAQYGRLTSAHHRFHPSASTPTESQTGVNELLVNAMLLDAPLHIHHDNDYGWWENQEKMQLSRDQGYNVWASYYPWTAGSGNYGASIVAPDNWVNNMGYKYEETIFDPQLDRYVSQEEFEEFAANEPGRTLIAFSPPREQWLLDWIKIPGFAVSGDGMPSLDAKGQPLNWDSPYEDYAGHPRSAGTHATVLRLSRENDIPLIFTLAQLSFYHAKFLGDSGLHSMQVRGRMQEGMVADITIFDPDTVTENASYTNGSNGLPSTGIPFVLVNGTVVVKDSKVQKDVTPGQAIRFPVEAESRFEPASREQWLNTFAIDNGGARPTLIEDITDDEAFVAPTEPATTQFAQLQPLSLVPQDWFAPANMPDTSSLFLCRVHGVLEDRATAEKDWANAVIAGLDRSGTNRFDPLLD